MPVFNAMSDFERGNGKFLLPGALESIFQQSFTDFELIILDNQSTDGTFQFLSDYAKTEPRLVLIRDVTLRNPEEAIHHLSTLVRSEFCCIVNDDDIWGKDFLQIMMDAISGSGFDLVYPNGYYLDIQGKKLHPLVDSIQPPYSGHFGIEANFNTYVRSRNPIPISFGLFKAEVFKKLYPSGKFDSYRANVDNLFIIKLILSGANIHFLDQALFNYRQKFRLFDPERDLGLAENPDILEIYERLIMHQARFHVAILEEISSFLEGEQRLYCVQASYTALIDQVDKMFLFTLNERNFDYREFRKLKKARNHARSLLLHDNERRSKSTLNLETISTLDHARESTMEGDEASEFRPAPNLLKFREFYLSYRLVELASVTGVSRLVKNIRR